MLVQVNHKQFFTKRMQKKKNENFSYRYEKYLNLKKSFLFEVTFYKMDKFYLYRIFFISMIKSIV